MARSRHVTTVPPRSSVSIRGRPPQDNQLMSQRRILGFKPQLRPEW
jgi:hypothetical protein